MGSDGGFFQREDSSARKQGEREVQRINIIEVIEAYTAEHPETATEFINWPWRKAEAFYDAHVKRKAVEAASRVKEAMIAGLWGNTNLDDGKQTRKNMLIEIEEAYDHAIKMIYSGESDEIDQETIESDPFLSAMSFDWAGENKKPDEELSVNTTKIEYPDFESDQS